MHPHPVQAARKQGQRGSDTRGTADKNAQGRASGCPGFGFDDPVDEGSLEKEPYLIDLFLMLSGILFVPLPDALFFLRCAASGKIPV